MNESLIKDLKKLSDKAVCCYTLDRAWSIFNRIKNQLDIPDQKNIEEMLHQIGNPDSCPAPNGWGNSKDRSYDYSCKQLCEYVKTVCKKLNEI